MEKKSAAEEPLMWNFPSTNHGEDDGFSDPLLEYFQGNHENYIAREAIQNAIDARKDYNLPVLVEFEHFEIPSKEIPGFEALLDTTERSLEYVKGQEKAENFFKKSLSILKKNKVPVLRIGDYNTIGLTGSDNDRDGNWYRLVRAVGTSSPKGAGGGSFGIGKGAPIAASGIRTVFYSSINDADETVFQGKARLVSHYGDGNDVKRGVGFFGVQGYQSVRAKKSVPSRFQREKQGTDVYIMGYVTGESWQKGLIKSVLDNFWLAIFDGDLEVVISDGKKIKIDRLNLEKLLEKYSQEGALPFYSARTDKNTTYFSKSIDSLGDVHLFVKKNDDYPSLTMLARKPKMKVRNRSYRILREPYAAVFLCDDDKGNKLLREMEPPKHDEWNWDLCPDKESGRKALRKMELFIKESLRSLNETTDTEPEEIPDLDRYLPDSDDKEDKVSDGGKAFEKTDKSDSEETAQEIGTSKESTELEIDSILKRSIMVKSPSIDIGNGDLPGGRNKGRGGEPRGGIGGEDSGEREGERIRTSDIGFRSFVQKTKSGLEYRFIINALEDSKGAIKLVAVGDDGSYPVEIKNARDLDSNSAFEINGSIIKGLNIPKGHTIRLGVALVYEKKYAIGIERYER